MASFTYTTLLALSFCIWDSLALPMAKNETVDVLGALWDITAVSARTSSIDNAAATSTIMPSPHASIKSTTPLAAPAPSNTSASVTLDEGLETLEARRITFIISRQTGAQKIPAWLASLGKDGVWPPSEVNYTTGCAARRANWPAQHHWIRISALAAAWHGGFQGADTSYIRNATLRAQIGEAMDWWFARDIVDDACLEGGTSTCPCSTPGLWNTNWFSNVILIPRLIGKACLLLKTTLTPFQLAHCTRITRRSYSTLMQADKPQNWRVGANLLDIASIGVTLGLLTADHRLVVEAYAHVHDEVRVQTGFQVDGILADGSFGQHAGLLYDGNYGKDYLNDVLELELEAVGTSFAAREVSKTAFEGFLDATKWMIYQNTATRVLHWDYSTVGRFISFPVLDQQATAGIKVNLTQVQLLGALWHSNVLQAVYNDLTTDTSTANIGNLLGNRMFWDNDYMVMRGKKYVSTLNMYSSRTRNSECINSENPKGFHLADGATFTYIRGDEYEDISAAWDWNLIPGTTVDYGATPLSCGSELHTGVEEFVGGVSTGKLGAAVMRYTNPLTRSLFFQKVWFHLANDVQHVMVSVLSSNSLVPVFSVLDQRKHHGPVYINNVTATSGNYSKPRSLFHGDIGYLFEDVQKVSVSVGMRTGKWSAIGISERPAETVDLFSAWIVHEEGHVNAKTNGSQTNSQGISQGHLNADASPVPTVAYTVFPGRTRSEFETEAGETTLQTLRADMSVSAVRDPAHGTTMIAFWRSNGGTVTGMSPVLRSLTSSGACVVILEERTWTITVADPTQRLETLRMTVEIGRAKPPGWEGNPVKSIEVLLPRAPKAGSSVSMSLLH